MPLNSPFFGSSSYIDEWLRLLQESILDQSVENGRASGKKNGKPEIDVLIYEII